MPNWCSTDSTIIFEDKKDCDKVVEELKKAMAIEVQGADKGWLGKLLIHIGVEKDDIQCHCRGFVQTWDRYDNVLCIYSEDAWSPALTPIYEFVQHYVSTNDTGEPNYIYLFTACEPGCEVYVSNDPDYVGKWVVDNWADDDIGKFESGYYEILPAEEVKEELEKYLGKTGELRDLIAEVEVQTDFNIGFHEYEYGEVADYCE